MHVHVYEFQIKYIHCSIPPSNDLAPLAFLKKNEYACVQDKGKFNVLELTTVLSTHLFVPELPVQTLGLLFLGSDLRLQRLDPSCLV